MLPPRKHPSTSCSKRKTEFMYRTTQPPPGFGVRQPSVAFPPSFSLVHVQKPRISEGNRPFLTNCPELQNSSQAFRLIWFHWSLCHCLDIASLALSPSRRPDFLN